MRSNSATSVNGLVKCHWPLLMRARGDVESVWKWREEKEQWLRILPNVVTVEIDVLLSFCAASRQYGDLEEPT